MEITLVSIAFIVSAICAGLMGFSIQRGGTCTVAAIDEIINHRRCFRLLGLLEASMWVVGGLLIAQALHALGDLPAGYRVSAITLVGGALLGLGAYVNRACVIGTLARLGSGEWAYVMTPLGFYLGCLMVSRIVTPDAAAKLPDPSPVLLASSWTALVFAGVMTLRIGHALFFVFRQSGATQGRTPWREVAVNRVWSPHAATAVIGVTFLVMLLLVGAWAYTDVLSELARGMAANEVARTALLIALVAGAIIGGATAGRLHSTPVSAAQIARCLSGGVLMAWGSLLIPGGNDGLILVGMPLLWPYAWVAFAAMCVSIAAAIILGQRHASGAVA